MSDHQNEVLIQFAELSRRVGMKKSAIYERIAAGTFPRPVKDGATNFWIESEVSAWVRARIDARDMGQNVGRSRAVEEKAA